MEDKKLPNNSSANAPKGTSVIDKEKNTVTDAATGKELDLDKFNKFGEYIGE